MSKKSALARLPRNVLVYGVGDLFSKGLQFLLLPVYLSYLNPSQYGTLALAMSYAVVAGLLLQLNLNSAVFRFFSDYENEAQAQKLAGTLIVFQLAWSIVLVPFLVIIVPSAPRRPGPGRTPGERSGRRTARTPCRGPRPPAGGAGRSSLARWRRT